jgi:hypothetical protein
LHDSDPRPGESNLAHDAIVDGSASQLKFVKLF